MASRRTRSRWQSWKQEIIANRYQLFLALMLLLIAVFIDYAVGIYVDSVGAAAVPDLVLDHLPVVNLEYVYMYGFILCIAALAIWPLVYRPHLLHTTVTQFSILVLIRGIFTVVTHLKAPAGAVPVHYPWPISIISPQNDLFFSGHVAVPFLGFLLFKDRIRYLFLALAIILGITVLLMHIHYTIDVLAAFFIAYGSYRLCNRFFSLKSL
jgi:membrane-associated phospholipid phosphatase